MAVLVLLVLTGCGGSGGGGAAHGVPTGPLTLDLKGGGNRTATACGASHHFAVFRSGQAIRFSGVIRPVPSGRWKVKLKLKVCRVGSFQELTKIDTVRDKSTGGYHGSFPAGAPGRYFARASLYEDGAVKARSDKRHFLVR